MIGRSKELEDVGRVAFLFPDLSRKDRSDSASRVGVGLLVQPLNITLLVMMIKENAQTRTFEITLKFFFSTKWFLASASFFGVVALAADRLLALHLHLRYQELVTQKRVVALVISIWIMSAIHILLFFF